MAIALCRSGGGDGGGGGSGGGGTEYIPTLRGSENLSYVSFSSA